ncbi:hypothetical protein AC578_7325 [Pseudocercospora eumusae]|uniref:Uncharacterized protein n=1 Tax=Pseudocercospora eumusae TaxID=321146 RepID=A0A139HWN5_9PEZI|nr:hypothetical protein AC578_7325 [Pseudocercospora eumusae]
MMKTAKAVVEQFATSTPYNTMLDENQNYVWDRQGLTKRSLVEKDAICATPCGQQLKEAQKGCLRRREGGRTFRARCKILAWCTRQNRPRLLYGHSLQRRIL